MAGNDFGILENVAPGTPLRDAIDLIVQQETGALVVLGANSRVDHLASGGFRLADADFSAQRLAELAKMDGAILLTADASRIVAANVQLNPNPSLATVETGMRHRTAERVAKDTGSAVIAVSEGRESASVYVGDSVYVLQDATSILAEANQALLSLERFRRQLTDAERTLTRTEVAGTTIVRDAVRVLQRAALVRALGRDLDRLAVQLGGEGQLVRLQVADLVEGVNASMELVYRDYTGSRAKLPKPLAAIQELALADLDDMTAVGSAADLGALESSVSPRGLRALHGVPRLPDAVQSALLSKFGTLAKLLQATASDFERMEGIGRSRARQLERYFQQLADLVPHLVDDD